MANNINISVLCAFGKSLANALGEFSLLDPQASDLSQLHSMCVLIVNEKKLTTEIMLSYTKVSNFTMLLDRRYCIHIVGRLNSQRKPQTPLAKSYEPSCILFCIHFCSFWHQKSHFFNASALQKTKIVFHYLWNKRIIEIAVLPVLFSHIAREQVKAPRHYLQDAVEWLYCQLCHFQAT